jgi:hypothetical protein
MDYLKWSSVIITAVIGLLIAVFVAIWIGVYILFSAGMISVYFLLQKKRIELKQLLGFYLLVITSCMLLGQVFYQWFAGFITTEVEALQFGFVLVFLFALSGALLQKRLEDNFKHLLYVGMIILVPGLLISSVAGALDVMGLTTTGAGTYTFPPLFGLSQLSSFAADIAFIVQTIVSIFPASVCIYGVIMIYVSSDPQKKLMSAFFAVLAAGTLVLMIGLFNAVNVGTF